MEKRIGDTSERPLPGLHFQNTFIQDTPYGFSLKFRVNIKKICTLWQYLAL